MKILRYLNYFFCRCQFGRYGPSDTKLDSPQGFCLGLNEEIIVADTNNNRIQIFDKDGGKIWQFGKQGILFDILLYVKTFLVGLLCVHYSINLH